MGKIEKAFGSNQTDFVNHPGIVTIMSQFGPFNTDEWRSLVKKDKIGAQANALDSFKDISLLVEAARPGAGIMFQRKLIKEDQSVDMDVLAKIDHQRTVTPLFLLYRDIPLMCDASSYLTFGKAFENLQPEEIVRVLEFGLITDLSHFSRIMGKMGRADDVQRNWRINEFAFAISRNLNDSFTSREMDESLYQVPSEGMVEARHQVVESTQDGKATSILSIREDPPNISFMFSFDNPSDELLEKIEVPVSHGRGEITFEKFKTTDQLLRYLSTQFESILLEHPVEKAALIFDKFLFGRGLDDFGISLSAVQAVKTEEGKTIAKILNVGNSGVVLVDKQNKAFEVASEDLSQIRNLSTPINKVEELAQHYRIKIDDLTGMTEKNKRNRIIGRFSEKQKEKTLSFDVGFVEPAADDARLGTINQVAHKITEIEFDSNTQSFAFIPSSLMENVHSLGNMTTSNSGEVMKQWTKGVKTSVSIKPVGFNEETLQTNTHLKWTLEIIIPQTSELIDEIRKLSQQFKEVNIFFQHSHIHPTQSKHSPKQEHGALIAKQLADQLVDFPNIKIRSGTLVDEFHTADLMADYSSFNEVIASIAGNMYEGLFTESSPAMNFIAKAIARIYLSYQGTNLEGGVVTHKIDETGQMVEVWDSATDANGSFTKGRCACVPFEIGMNIALMESELTHELFVKYLLSRFPDSELAGLVKETDRENTDQLLVERILYGEKNTMERNEHRMRLLNQVEIDTFEEVSQLRPDITGFDVFALDQIYRRIMDNLKTKKRLPIVIHVLESNYAGQQTKSGWSWENRVGIPGIQVFRVSFDSGSGKIDILKSRSPTDDHMGNFLRSNADIIEELATI